MLPKAYPWNSITRDSTVVDVGGGTGHVMMSVMKQFPHIRVIVQDVESAIAVGKQV